MKPSCAICIPTYKRLNALELNLKQISLLMDIVNLNLEVVVSDNATDEHSAKEICAAFDFVRYHQNSVNIGVYQNILRVLALAESDYVFLLGDDDYIIRSGFLEVVHEMSKMSPFITGPLLKMQTNQEGEVSASDRVYFALGHQVVRFAGGEVGSKELFNRCLQMSGLVFRRELIDLWKPSNFEDCMYPHALVALQVVSAYGASYISNPIVQITITEERHWKYSADHNVTALANACRAILGEYSWASNFAGFMKWSVFLVSLGSYSSNHKFLNWGHAIKDARCDLSIGYRILYILIVYLAPFIPGIVIENLKNLIRKIKSIRKIGA